MYRNALVPIDGSHTSRAALDQASHVVAPDGHVLLVQVVDDAGRVAGRTTPAGFEFSSFAASMSIVDQMIEAQREEAIRRLEEAREALIRAGLRSVETAVLDGLPGPAIVETAEERGCDVIIMGTHGRSGLRRAFLGSVAEHVIRHISGLPVLLVRANDEPDDERDHETIANAIDAPIL